MKIRMCIINPLQEPHNTVLKETIGMGYSHVPRSTLFIAVGKNVMAKSVRVAFGICYLSLVSKYIN